MLNENCLNSPSLSKQKANKKKNNPFTLKPQSNPSSLARSANLYASPIMVSPSHLIFIQDNYKCDQYRWLNSGPKDIPRKNPLVKKQYFIGKLPSGKTQVSSLVAGSMIINNR